VINERFLVVITNPADKFVDAVPSTERRLPGTTEADTALVNVLQD
jgi:hypothetical protein